MEVGVRVVPGATTELPSNAHPNKNKPNVLGFILFTPTYEKCNHVGWAERSDAQQ